MSIVNAYNANNIQEGDVFIATVTIHVGYTRDGKYQIRVYRCPYPNPPLSFDGVLLGSNISPEHVPAIIAALAPITVWANGEVDPTA
jgi:hypothetical protein